MTLLLVLVSATSNATLLSRLSGQAYYDTVLNVTWLADANYAKTSGFDATGQVSWTQALAFIGALNTADYLGVNHWRLPTATDTGTPGCNFAVAGTDCGYNVDLATGEMAHLFYESLGNTGAYNTSAVVQPCISASLPYCLSNAGPFSSLQPSIYWSGAEYAPDTIRAWDFVFSSGIQFADAKTSNGFAWPVLDGDIAAVPVPSAAGLLASAFCLLIRPRSRVAST
jgi:Protein of unknown function (DUF1566)